MRITTMDKVSMGQIVDVFNRGFGDYLIPVSMDEIVLKDYIFVNDISVKDSFISFDDQGKPQALTFTAIRGKIGWISGLGVAKETRGQGYGRAILKVQMERVDELELKETWLECIESNQIATNMYLNAGFKKIRRIWFLQNDSPKALDVRPPDFERRVVSVEDVLPYYDKEHIWPKSEVSLKRIKKAHVAFAMKGEKMMAYIIVFPSKESTYLWDLTPNKYGEALLGQLIRSTETRSIHVANLHKKALLSLLQRWGFIINMTLWTMKIKRRSGFWG